MTTVEEMACQELVERVTEYLDVALTDADRMRFEEHVDACPGCEEVLQQFQAVIQLTGHLELGRIAAVLHCPLGEPHPYFAGRSRYDTELAAMRTPEAVRRWGFLMNMTEDAFRSLFVKFAG